MNWLLSLPSRFINLFSGLFSNLTNPFRAVSSIGRSFTSQLQYIVNLPSRYLNLPQGVGSGWLQDMKDSLSFRNDPAVRKRVKVGETAQYSQIHLTNMTTQTRSVVHIGTTIGRSSSDWLLGVDNTTRLRFSQMAAGDTGGQIGLTVAYSRAKVLLDGVPVSGEVALKDGATISVGDQPYAVKLFAWDRTPIVIRVTAGWATSTGTVRDNNEDAIGIYQHRRGYLFGLADGVGGAQHGEQMSAFAIHYLLAVFNRNIAYDLDWAGVLGKAYQNINAEIRNFVKRSAFNAGSTLTSVVIKDWEASIAHVGDSRLYHWRNDTLTQITRDHAHREAVINNTRHANETRTPPPMRDVLEKALGKSDQIDPDLINLRLLPGDKLLLCSDGVTGVIPIDDLAQVVANESAKVLAETLVRMANEKGTKDNASAVAVEVMREGYVEDIWQARESDRVYVGYRSRPLRLGKPEDNLETHHPERRGSRIRWVVGLVALVLIVWGISALNGRQQAAAAVISPTATATAPAESADLALTRFAQTQTAIVATLTSLSPPVTLNTPITPDFTITGTPPAMSSASRIEPAGSHHEVLS